MDIRLNEQQQAAVFAPPDAALILVASPGSGKTAVLTQRVAHLVAEHDVEPSSMVVTTFTRKAADEMKERLVPLIGADAASRLNIGTIHSICLKVLREERMAKELISAYDQKKIVQEELSYKRLNWDVGWRYPFGWLMKAKNALVEPKESQDWFFQRLMALNDNRWQAMDLSQKLARVYRVYEEEKRYLGKMDFTDMIVWTAKLLMTETRALRKWQSRVQYVLVDEVQDTGNLPYKILRLLAEPENRFFAVGDPDQELFRWNGADPEHNIFGFTEMFPDGMVLPLEVNYRSTKTIVELANRAIAENYATASDVRLKFKKNLKPHPGAKDGKAVEVTQHANVEDEAAYVRERIAEAIEGGRSPRDFFVVYRVNSQSRAIEDELLKAKVPYVVQGSLGFYDRKVVKDMLAYLTLVDNPHNDEAFQRVANIATQNFFRPTRGFGSRWMQECMALASANRESMWNAMLVMQKRAQRWQKEAIDDLVSMVESIKTRSLGNPRDALGMIRSMAYEPYLLRTEGVDESTAQEEGLLDDLDELCYAAGNFGTINEYMEHVQSIRELQAKRNKENVDAVVLTTIHRVKGLERPVVFGIGLAESVLPHRFAIGGSPDQEKFPVENLSGVEDERCAVFVLVSRAKEELYLNYPMMYRNREVEPSRFLYEMGLLAKEEEESDGERTKEPVAAA